MKDMFTDTKRVGQWLAIAVVVALIYSAAASAKKPPKPDDPPDDEGSAYTIIPFMPAESESIRSEIWDINDAGQAVGVLTYADGSREALHLDIGSGAYTTLHDGGTPLGINNLNQIVGRNAASGLFWSSPTALPIGLPPLPGDLTSSAEGINDAGIVFGVSEGLVGNSYVASCVVWRVCLDENQELQVDGPRALPPLLNDTWWPYDVNEVVNGTAQVVGESDGEAVVWTVEMTPDGTLSAANTSEGLGVPEDLGASWSAGYGINCFGDVCGKADDLPFEAPVGGECRPLPLPRKALSGNAFGINDNGEVVGYALLEVRKQATKYAQLWRDGEPIDLTSQTPRDSGWKRLSAAWLVNNTGVIAGVGSFDVPNRGFILIPNTP